MAAGSWNRIQARTGSPFVDRLTAQTRELRIVFGGGPVIAPAAGLFTIEGVVGHVPVWDQE